MSKVIVCERKDLALPDNEGARFCLGDLVVRGCAGCFSCWWSTPGRCIYHDLDQFYEAYVNAETVFFYPIVSRGFVSGNMKTLFDRMLPLFLPYSNFHTGESMHDARYARYPDIEVYYEGAFLSQEERQSFEAYFHRTFYHFHSKSVVVKALTEREAAV